jgi:Trk K+ transport system NAD-binding subunit
LALMTRSTPAVIVGNDALTESVCRNLCADGWRVTVVWDDEPGLRERIEASGATFLGRSPLGPDALRAAGIEDARTLLALAVDDRTNLEVALEAREANARVRIVMRQFNQALARKIEENLRDCAVLSLAARSAATYAAAAIDPECFFGLEFPLGSRSLVGFSKRTAEAAGVADLGVAEAEQKLRCRVLSCNGVPCEDEGRLSAGDELIVFGPVEQLARSAAPLKTARGGFGWVAARIRAIVSEFDPLLRVLIVAGAIIFVAATLFFSAVLQLNVLTAAYFVTATMTTTGYGDISLKDSGLVAQAIGIVVMVCGIVIANLAIAFVAAALVRSQWNALQGMRPIRYTGHILVFGAGRVGTRIVDFLCKLDAIVTVVELEPSPQLVARARAREISLLTGNGALDETLDLSNAQAARCAVVVTDSDATNLEIGLGARARRPGIPVIVRIAEPRFAAAIRKQFEIRRAFSMTALASSAFSDLAESDAARGRVSFDGKTYRLEERPSAEADRAGLVLAAASSDTGARAVRTWSGIEPDERVLVIATA